MENTLRIQNYPHQTFTLLILHLAWYVSHIIAYSAIRLKDSVGLCGKELCVCFYIFEFYTFHFGIFALTERLAFHLSKRHLIWIKLIKMDRIFTRKYHYLLCIHSDLQWSSLYESKGGVKHNTTQHVNCQALFNRLLFSNIVL